MTRFILSRLLQTFVALVGSTLLVFFLARQAGNPVDLLLGPIATPEQEAALNASLGLDQPVTVQYLRFLGSLLHGDLGMSIQFQEPASQLFLERAPATLLLAAVAFALALVVAIPAGIYAAHRPNGLLDRVTSGVAAAGQAMPSFWFGTLLIYVFAVRLAVLPTSGADSTASLVLPAITLAFFGFAGLMRITRSATMETLSSEYVRFARTKGASENRVLWRHAFRNSGMNILTFGTLVLLNMITGSIVVETVFGWPGVGQLVVQAVQNRDFPVVQSVVLILTTLYCVGNLITDVFYAFLNPRIRYSS
ncbi:ABC transporter permease [Amycolatopsis sp. NPDC051372]|uniref:ABC transporter permease n=1 Tax=Amycolatopsis sp. NPDC051372 TaxID=3155669 RepID=UPI00343B28AC